MPSWQDASLNIHQEKPAKHKNNKNNKTLNPPRRMSAPKVLCQQSLNQSHKKIKSLNQIQMHKILEEGQKNIEDKVKDKKRKLRSQFIKEELEKLKEEKSQKEKKRNLNLEEEKKKIEEKMQHKLLSQQKIRDKIKNELEKIKEMRLEENRKKEERGTKEKKQL